MAVSLQEIADELSRPTPDQGSAEARRWSMWVDDAYAAIERRADRLQVDLDTIPDTDVDRVVRKAVAAHVRRPDDATQVTKNVDDGGVTRIYQSARGEVTITDRWWSDLGLADDASVFSVQMTGTPDTRFYPEPWT